MASKYGVFNATLTGDWARLGTAFANLSMRFPQAMESALHEEGEFYRNKMIEGIREQAPGGQPFRPLSPVTLALRKLMGFSGTKALIRTSEMRNNIVSIPGKGWVFVGIPKTARGEDGRNLAEIGGINEYGGVVRASISKARMRLIAAAMRKTRGRSSGSGGGAGIGMVRIPARPFIRPVIAMYGGRRGAERYMARVARKLGGLLGVINHPDLGGFGVERLPERLAGGRAGGMSKGLRMMRRGGTGKAKKQGKFSLKKSLAKGLYRPGRGVGVRLKRPPRAPRKPKIIRPRLPKPRAVKKPKTPKVPAAVRRTTGRKFKPIKPPKPPKAPRAPKTRQPKGHPFANVNKWMARGKANLAKQKAAEQKRLAREVQKVERAQERAKARAARDKARAEKQAERDYMRANPQHNAHVKARQIRINFGHDV
jgi:hypothetical protein